MADSREILELKEKIDEAKNKLAESNGQLKTIKKDLKNRWGFDTIDQARKALKEAEQEKEELENKKEEIINDIKENYDI